MTRVILKLPSIRGPLRWSTASSEFRVRVSTALRALSPLEIVFALHPRDAAHGMVGTSRHPTGNGQGPGTAHRREAHIE